MTAYGTGSRRCCHRSDREDAGASRWSAVHRADAAALVRLAIERAPAGSTLHAVADEGVPLRDIAAVIGRHLGVPTTLIAPEDADGHFGWLAAMPR
jgi:nucleoside-diphosphate-sugar epimerase